MLDQLVNWFGGWRTDADGYLVRARRFTDPDLTHRPEIGFSEESAIAVHNHLLARMVDRGQIAQAANRRLRHQFSSSRSEDHGTAA